MKKRGFTLVELLAVIAILAILVIIALPNIMKLFNDARKNSFKTELKTIFKTSQQEWLSDSMFSTSEQVYSKCENGCTNGLKMSGRNNIDYYIKVNKTGNITEFYVTDGTYQYEYSGSGLNIENVDSVEQVSELSSEEVISITSSGKTGGHQTFNGTIYRDGQLGFSSGYIGKSIVASENVWCMVAGDYDLCDEVTYYNMSTQEECEQTLAYARTSNSISPELQALAQIAECRLENRINFPNYTTNISDLTWDYAYLKHDVVNGIVTTAYLCPYYTVNGIEKTVCLKGYDASAYGNATTGNVKVLKDLEQEGFSCSFDSSVSSCDLTNGTLFVQSNGKISYGVCNIYTTGETLCD